MWQDQLYSIVIFICCFQAANENLNFDQQILEAAKSIAAATAALVKSASAAQKELVLQGKVSKETLSVISLQWSS